MSHTLKKSLIKGSLWSIIGQMISLLIVFITNIILARVLSPHEFGQIGIVMFFLTLMSVVSESGLGGALVRKKNATTLDYSTVFVTNLVFSIILYITIVLVSPFISSFYNDPYIKDLLIVASLVILINAFQISQNAKLVSELRFKQKYIYKLIATFIASCLGIVLVFHGFGVWSLVVIHLTTAILFTLLLWIFEGFALSLSFSRKSFTSMYAFGINTTLSSVINSVFDNIYQLVLAKYFSIIQTGNYYQAKRLQDVPGGVLNVVSQGPVYAILAKLQDNKRAFISMYNDISKLFSIVLGLISIIVYSYAEPIIIIIYGEKWSGAVYFMQMLTFASFFYIQENINRIIFKVYNRTRYILVLDIFKKIIQALSILIGVLAKNIEILIYGFVITSLIGYAINFYISRKVLNNFNTYEIKIIIKIIVAVIIIILGKKFVFSKLDVSYFHETLTIPLVILFYLIVLLGLKVIDKNDYIKVRNLKK